jgi:hypothetical protein
MPSLNFLLVTPLLALEVPISRKSAHMEKDPSDLVDSSSISLGAIPNAIERSALLITSDIMVLINNQSISFEGMGFSPFPLHAQCIVVDHPLPLLEK